VDFKLFSRSDHFVVYNDHNRCYNYFMINEIRLELNLDINDHLTKEQIAEIVKRLLENGIRKTSYGIVVQSVKPTK
jgi:hypothetical protein